MTLPDPPPSLRDDPEASRLLVDMLDDARTEDALDAAALDRLVARVDALGPAQATTPRPSHLALKLGIAAMLAALGIGVGGLLLTPEEAPEHPPVEASPPAPRIEAPAPTPPEPVIDTAPEARPAPAEARSEGPTEGALLLAARVALRTEHPARALALTTQHETRFPRGTMREERDVIAIEALMQLGERGRAERRKDAFLQRYPSSPYRARIDALFTP